MTFVKVLEGTSQYKFCFSRKFRPVQFFEEKRGQTGVDWGIPGRPAPWRSGVPVHTARPRLSSASGPNRPHPEVARLPEAPRPEGKITLRRLKVPARHVPRRRSRRTAPARAAVWRCYPRSETPLSSSRSHEGSRPARL
jgi:hypothetical protein